jgi:DNA helicase-2/ATP-dependent DNA helicase PcrA
VAYESNVLKELEGEDVEEVLEIARLRDTLLWRRNIPKELDLALQTSNVVVSTIHRAKGKEYDNVLWVIEGDEAKEPNVVYVAVSRPKTGLYISEVKKPLYVKSLPSSRLIESRWSRRRSAKNPHCSAIVLGLEGDVDPFSVLSKERAAAIERQEYIEKYVQPGDSVEIGLLDGRYRVFHGGREIAWLSERVVNDLWNGMQVTNRSQNYPKELRGCYIRAVTTLVNRGFNESVPEPFALSCFWLGIEVGGLAKTSWY